MPLSLVLIAAVEKLQLAYFDNSGTAKDEQLTGHRKPQNAQI